MDNDPVAPAPTAEEWQADLTYLAAEMEGKHKNLYANIPRDEWAGAVQRLHTQIPALARHEVIVGLARLAALVGDGHTNLYLDSKAPGLGFHRWPVRLGLLEGVLFIRSAAPEHRDVLGARVTRVGTVPAAEAVAQVCDLIGAENEMRRLSWAPTLLAVPEILHARGMIPALEAATLEIEQEEDRRTLTLPMVAAGAEVPWVHAHELSAAPIPLYLQDPHNAFWFTYLYDAQTLYLQYNAVRDKEEETLAAFFARVFALDRKSVV